jgi:hypothetical protein
MFTIFFPGPDPNDEDRSSIDPGFRIYPGTAFVHTIIFNTMHLAALRTASANAVVLTDFYYLTF